MKALTKYIRYTGSSITLALMSVLVLSGSVFAQSGGIGGRVANPDPTNPRSQSIFIYTLDHDQTKTDQILVVNNTDQEKTINLKSVDGVLTNTGAYTCRQADEPIEDSGGWVKLAKSSVTLPSGGEEKVDFTVTVPPNADVGEHNSCITIQADEDQAAVGSGVLLRMRQAIRMAITIPGDLHRELAISKFERKYFEADQKGYEYGKQKYALQVANKGNVSADVDMRITITSLFNREVGIAKGTYPVIPNQTLDQEFAIEFTPMFGGWFSATPSIRYDSRLGIYGTESDAKYETKTGESIKFFLWPTTTGWIVIIGSLMILMGLIGYLIVSSRRNKKLKKTLHSYVVRQGDTIQYLAERTGMNWKDIAKLNKLSAPYTLTPGQKIVLSIKKNLTSAAASHAKPTEATKR